MNVKELAKLLSRVADDFEILLEDTETGDVLKVNNVDVDMGKGRVFIRGREYPTGD